MAWIPVSLLNLLAILPRTNYLTLALVSISSKWEYWYINPCKRVLSNDEIKFVKYPEYSLVRKRCSRLTSFYHSCEILLEEVVSSILEAYISGKTLLPKDRMLGLHIINCFILELTANDKFLPSKEMAHIKAIFPELNKVLLNTKLYFKCCYSPNQ